MIKRLLSSFSAMLVVLIMSIGMAMPVFATNEDLDGLTGDSVSDSAEAGEDDGVGALGEALQDYEPVSDENVKEAQKLASPLTNLIGNLVGVITLVVAAGIFFVTACDFAYIGLPFTRNLLTSRWQIVSDEAIAVVQPPMQNGMQNGMQSGMGMNGMAGGMGMSGMGMNGMRGGMGMSGMGMNGMNGMNGMGGMGMAGGMNGQQMSFKSCITSYLKKRIVFIVIFTVATILLTSSALTGVGINLAALLFNVIDKINEAIGNVKM